MTRYSQLLDAIFYNFSFIIVSIRFSLARNLFLHLVFTLTNWLDGAVKHLSGVKISFNSAQNIW